MIRLVFVVAFIIGMIHGTSGAQQPDGSWMSTGKVFGGYGQVPSTAFAILFLRKATESLIDTGKKTPELKKIEPPKKPEPKDIDTQKPKK